VFGCWKVWHNMVANVRVVRLLSGRDFLLLSVRADKVGTYRCYGLRLAGDSDIEVCIGVRLRLRDFVTRFETGVSGLRLALDSCDAETVVADFFLCSLAIACDSKTFSKIPHLRHRVPPGRKAPPGRLTRLTCKTAPLLFFNLTFERRSTLTKPAPSRTMRPHSRF
jgi:hypothetical protein